MKKICHLFILVAVFFALAIGTVWATDYYVRTDGSDSNDGTADDSGHAWLTIQHAINSVAPGDTINVAAGTYSENVNVGKPLTLQASSTPIIDGNLAGPCITVAADGVTIDGFELTNGTAGVASWGTDNSVVSQCVIHDNLNVPGSMGPGIMFWSGSDDFDNNTIEGNEIFNNDRQGIYIGGTNPSYISEGNTISGNTIYNNGLYTYPNGPDASAYGIQLSFADGNTIKNNEVYGHDDWFPWGGTTFDWAQGIYLCAAFGNTVTGNDLHDNNFGVGAYSAGRTPVGSNQINYNSIHGNTGYGIMNSYDPVTFDGEYNWWGDASGPSGEGGGSGDGVSINVDFDPWMNIYYGDVSLSGGFQSGHFPELWCLTAEDLVISFTYDANGLVDDFGGAAHAWSALGVRTVGYGDFNPTWQVEGAGVWLATDYDSAVDTFDPDPAGFPTIDLDDKLILQKAGGHGEGDYNLPSTPPNPWANHRIWWDRDGVDPWQNPETANTGGFYNIEITLHATSNTSGEAYMRINGLYQGFETDSNWNTIELIPAGMTFTGDMTQMQVFYGLYGYGATHSVEFKEIMVKGRCLGSIIKVAIDIKPGSEANDINLGAHGVIPVAILSSGCFDATTVDPDTVELAGASVAVRGKSNKSMAHVKDVNGDGLVDLVVQVETENLDPDSFQAGHAILIGETYNGVAIEGSDYIIIVKE